MRRADEGKWRRGAREKKGIIDDTAAWIIPRTPEHLCFLFREPISTRLSASQWQKHKKKITERYLPFTVFRDWIMQCVFLRASDGRLLPRCHGATVIFWKNEISTCPRQNIFGHLLLFFAKYTQPSDLYRVLESSKQIARDKRIWIIPRAYAYPFWYPILLEGSTPCHPPQTLVFHLSRRTGLLTAQGIGVLPRKRFVASVLGRRQREYLVTYVRQLAGGIKENFCSKVCFLRSAVARL